MMVTRQVNDELNGVEDGIPAEPPEEGLIAFLWGIFKDLRRKVAFDLRRKLGLLTSFPDYDPARDVQSFANDADEGVSKVLVGSFYGPNSKVEDILHKVSGASATMAIFKTVDINGRSQMMKLGPSVVPSDHPNHVRAESQIHRLIGSRERMKVRYIPQLAGAAYLAYKQKDQDSSEMLKEIEASILEEIIYLSRNEYLFYAGKVVVLATLVSIFCNIIEQQGLLSPTLFPLHFSVKAIYLVTFALFGGLLSIARRASTISIHRLSDERWMRQNALMRLGIACINGIALVAAFRLDVFIPDVLKITMGKAAAGSEASASVAMLQWALPYFFPAFLGGFSETIISDFLEGKGKENNHPRPDNQDTLHTQAANGAGAGS